jgi:uncharacterized membrane protein SpoIIM required for sporulation
MWQGVGPIAGGFLLLAFFLAGGIASTFYTRWFQRFMVDRSRGMPPFVRKVYQSSYFIWQTRVAGIIALWAAALTLFALIRSLARILVSGR